MILTDEQNKIIEAMKRPDCKLIKINAVSGAGKSSTLVEIAKALKIKSGLYISYNKAIATEASEKFSAEVLCKTIHSLAYGYTMSSFPLRLVPTLKARMITESIPAIRKSFLVDILSKYMLSREITIADFVEKYYKDKVSEDEIILMRDYFIKMKEGKIECSHDFYLKLFHILMHHKIIKTPEYDILMMDESGDITGVSLEIFKLIRANKKVMVGDSCLPGNSKIKTSNGWRNIISIVKDIESKKEVKVWSYNHNNDTFEFKKVVGSLRTGKKQCYKLKTTRSSLECTANHKIATPYGYKRLDELKIGDLILKDGDINLSNTKTTKCSNVEELDNNNVNYTVDVITSIEKTRTTETYDIEVEDNHNFITSMTAQESTACGILVHNCQNIYSFNQTINGFEALSDEGEQLTLSQSFRVSTSLAPYVKEFCNTYLDPHMDFEGFPYKAMPEQKDITMFYIARTNSGIISRMIELDLQGRRYNLTRPVYSIFALPLLLLRLNKTPDSEIREPEYKFLEADMKEWMTNPKIREDFKKPLAYILSQHSDDTNISSAMNLLRKFNPWQIIQTYQNAKSHEKSSTKYKITITSAHSSKGLTKIVPMRSNTHKQISLIAGNSR